MFGLGFADELVLLFFGGSGVRGELLVHARGVAFRELAVDPAFVVDDAQGLGRKIVEDGRLAAVLIGVDAGSVGRDGDHTFPLDAAEEVVDVLDDHDSFRGEGRSREYREQDVVAEGAHIEKGTPRTAPLGGLIQSVA